ncbi:MAG: hypothetical protein ILO36_06320 [Abditibacteriota bacterium]|nr:hypothetical protein [Abditibacteriota bacterium]
MPSFDFGFLAELLKTNVHLEFYQREVIHKEYNDIKILDDINTIAPTNTEANYYIVSEDKGYAPEIDRLKKEYGVSINVINKIEDALDSSGLIAAPKDSEIQKNVKGNDPNLKESKQKTNIQKKVILRTLPSIRQNQRIRM